MKRTKKTFGFVLGMSLRHIRFNKLITDGKRGTAYQDSGSGLYYSATVSDSKMQFESWYAQQGNPDSVL